MKSREELKRHVDLLDRMAKRVGADLETAMLAGCLTPEDLSEAVLRCTGCPAPEHCGELLRGKSALSVPPRYCRNRDLLIDMMAVT